METSSALLNPETELRTAFLPVGEHLRHVYEDELWDADLPNSAHFASVDETENVIQYAPGDGSIRVPDIDTPQGVAELRKNYVRTSAGHASMYDSWWTRGLGYNRGNAAVVEVPHQTGPEIQAKHVLEARLHGEPTGQTYEVWEVDDEVSRQELETVYRTLELIDQFSGGSLVASGEPQRVMLLSAGHQGGKEFAGLNNTQLTALNMGSIRRAVKKYDIDEQVLLATVLVHEMLGHEVERFVEGTTGVYFDRHFVYSDQKVAHERYGDIHQDVIAKDPLQAQSQPGSDYSRYSPGEDLAMSAEAMVAEAMRWNDELIKMPTLYAVNDAYRSDLVMEMLENAAKQGARHAKATGFIGNVVEYVDEIDGLAARPARSFSITDMTGEEAVTQELSAVVAKYTNISEFIVQRFNRSGMI